MAIHIVFITYAFKTPWGAHPANLVAICDLAHQPGGPSTPPFEGSQHITAEGNLSKSAESLSGERGLMFNHTAEV